MSITFNPGIPRNNSTEPNGKKRKICFLIGPFYPFINGAISQVISLSDIFIENGMSVLVITGRASKTESHCETHNGIEIVRVSPAIEFKNHWGKYIRLIPTFFELIKQREKYDLIIVSDFHVRGLAGVFSSKILNKKCFLRAESNGEMNGRYSISFADSVSPIKLALINILVKLRNIVLLRSDGFISISSTIRQEYLASGVPKDRIVDITNGVNVNQFTPVSLEKKYQLLKKLGLPGGNIFIYSGRLAKGKGLECLLNVWKKLIYEVQNIHLVLVGSGSGYSQSIEEDLKKFIKENFLENTVTITGSVENVHEYLQAGDFFVFPSQKEALGISLLEALSCELPCIASQVGGILDIIKNNVNGILVPYGDENKLLESMKWILKNKEKARIFGREGRKTVIERFNIERIAHQYELL